MRPTPPVTTAVLSPSPRSMPGEACNRAKKWLMFRESYPDNGSTRRSCLVKAFPARDAETVQDLRPATLPRLAVRFAPSLRSGAVVLGSPRFAQRGVVVRAAHLKTCRRSRHLGPLFQSRIGGLLSQSEWDEERRSRRRLRE
jgi:hypothetical protein